ncbi:MAG: RNA polymerase sigma factor SigZ [Bacteroidota bacterium]
MESQIEQLYEPLFLYVKKRINVLEDAEDLTQEIFLKLANSDTNGVNSLKSWMFNIAKNTIIDFYRKKRVINEIDEDNIYIEDFAENTIAAELSQSISNCINLLPEEYRLVLTLSEIEGMPQKEVAEKLGMNYTTVRSKIQRGRKKLRTLFAECCHVKQGGRGSIIGYELNRDCGPLKKCSYNKKC